MTDWDRSILRPFKILMHRKFVAYFVLLWNVIVLTYVTINYSNLFNKFEAKSKDKSYFSPLYNKFDQFQRLQKDDLSANLPSIDDFQDEIYEWDICESLKKTNDTSSDLIS